MSFNFSPSLLSTVTGAAAYYVVQQNQEALEEQETAGQAVTPIPTAHSTHTKRSKKDIFNLDQPSPAQEQARAQGRPRGRPKRQLPASSENPAAQTAVPGTEQLSYADLTVISLDPKTKKTLDDLSSSNDVFKAKIERVFDAKKWYNIITEGKSITLSIKEAMDIIQISGDKDIINLNSPITKIPVTDKLTEIRNLTDFLKHKRLLKTELGQLTSLVYKIIDNNQQSITKERAEKLDAVYKKHMGQILFDFNSIVPKAIQVAQNPIEQEQTYSQFSSTSKKRSINELTSLKGDQPQRKKTRRAKKANSLASLTTINIEPYKKTLKEDVDQKIQKKIRNSIGDNVWHGIINGTTNSISIDVAVRISEFVKIIKFHEDSLVQIACSFSQENLNKAEAQDSESKVLIARFKQRPPKFVTLETARKMNALSDPDKPIFDIKSILSQAIQEAKSQTKETQIETGSLQQQYYDQETQYNTNLIQQQNNLYQQHNAFLSQQEQYPLGTLQQQYYDQEQYNTNLIQQQNNQYQQHNTFLSQQEQYYDYSKTQYNPTLIQQQNNPPEETNNFPSQQYNYQPQFYLPPEEYNDGQLEQIETGSFQQQNNLPEQNNVVPSLQEQYPQYDDFQIEQTETVLPHDQVDQVKQPEQFNDDLIQELFGADEWWNSKEAF